MSDTEYSKEEQILQAVRAVLVNVARDTATEPGMKHPLKESTINAIRDCLALISQREHELAHAAGRPSGARPRMPGDEVPRGDVVIPFDQTGLSRKKDDSD